VRGRRGVAAADDRADGRDGLQCGEDAFAGGGAVGDLQSVDSTFGGVVVEISRDTVDDGRSMRRAIVRADRPAAIPREISSRSARVSWLALRRRGIGGIPPHCRKYRRIRGSVSPSVRSISRIASPRRHIAAPDDVLAAARVLIHREGGCIVSIWQLLDEMTDKFDDQFPVSPDAYKALDLIETLWDDPHVNQVPHGWIEFSWNEKGRFDGVPATGLKAMLLRRFQTRQRPKRRNNRGEPPRGQPGRPRHRRPSQTQVCDRREAAGHHAVPARRVGRHRSARRRRVDESMSLQHNLVSIWEALYFGTVCAVRDWDTDDCTWDVADNTYSDGREVMVQIRIEPEDSADFSWKRNGVLLGDGAVNEHPLGTICDIAPVNPHDEQ
jgi:hypothetical protein